MKKQDEILKIESKVEVCIKEVQGTTFAVV